MNESLSLHHLAPGNTRMMDWVPIVFVTFKLLVFGTCMFFAIKWHYDREKEEQEKRNKETSGPSAPVKQGS